MSTRRLHLWAGLIVAAYVIPHMLNHAVGLISLDAMEAMRRAIHVLWLGPLGELILVGAFLTHALLGLWTLAARATLRMPIWKTAQITLGLLIVPLLLNHIVGTSGVRHLLGFEPSYEYVVAALWIADPVRGLQQAILALVVWGHLCIGLHVGLRQQTWYRLGQVYIYAAMALIPVLALLGFAAIGRQLAATAETDPGFLPRLFAPIFAPGTADTVAQLKQIEPACWLVFGLLILSVLVARIVRHHRRSRIG